MIHPTDEELEALVHDLRAKCPYPAAGNAIVIGLLGEAADAITALRAQLAEVKTERDHWKRWSDINDAVAKTTSTRADRAEAALAAQIEDACAVIDAHAEYDQTFCCDGRECGCQGASVHDMMKHFIRQPHDRYALDRMLAEARENALMEAEQALVGALEKLDVREGWAAQIARDALAAWKDK